MLPVVVDMFPTATIVPFVDLLPFAVTVHASTYVPPDYVHVANDFVRLNLESVNAVL